ncbi:hypothetical protein V6K52_12610 [Knoellia sp. S7-12]|uniref:hypothetical protein n=1 Tax=Knoellia sp. S7-12 TaxID=3126698 RepID=UPI0033692212
MNGDGHEDAIVKLMANEGNGYQDSTTAWVWDPDSARPKQVIPAISLDERCGNVTRSVKFSKTNTFTVTRLMRVDENCATRPTKVAKLTIKVKGGFAWQTAPTVTALGCPHVGGRGLNFPGSDFGKNGPRAWPDPAAPVMITGKNIVAMDYDDSREGVPSGWNRVLFIRSDRDKAEVPPCGYFRAP